MRLINDCIYGMVRVPAYAERVLAAPLFQRLGRVRQLGSLEAAWPSAVHTRKEHSIGTMHLALEYARHLALDSGAEQAFVLASLLHDIGHGPFSHTFELALPTFCHDEFRFELLESADLDVIPAPVRAEIAAIWRGAGTPQARALHGLLAGPAGVDRMDYLVRDSYHTTPQCRLDATCVQAIIAHTTVEGDTVVYSPKGSKYVCHLLEARDYMYREVYRHRRAVAADALIVSAFREGLGSAAAPLLTPAMFERLDDAWVTTRAWDDGAPYAQPLRQFLRQQLDGFGAARPKSGGVRHAVGVEPHVGVACTTADGRRMSVADYWLEWRASTGK